MNNINNETNRNHDGIREESCTTSVIFLPKTQKSIINKNIHWGHATKELLYNLRGHESQRKNEERLKETKEAHMTAEGNVRFWPESFCCKGQQQFKIIHETCMVFEYKMISISVNFLILMILSWLGTPSVVENIL